MAVLILLAGLLLASCALLLPGADGEPIQVEVVRSEKERITSPDVDQTELDELVAGNSAFAFDLFQATRESGTNLFYSPYSISVALVMTYAGARGNTEAQIRDTLHFTLTQERLHPAFNALDLELASRNELPEGWEGEAFTLNIANSIWGQTGYPFLPYFLDALALNYGAGLRLLDFITASEACRIVINDWVSEETAGKIEDLLSQGAITSDTRLVLVNAIYFNAAWLFPFEEEATHNGIFYLLNGSQVTVPMMEQEHFFHYTEGDGYQAVELPYNGEQLSMVILLPETGAFQGFEQSLTAERFSSIVSDLERENVHLTMPKFTYESSFSLGETLAGMGMLDAFQPGVADFSGMDGTRNLFISEVIHKAFVSVDEAGTEAAAATAVIMPTSGPPTTTVEVTIDRPFLFVIRDNETGAILFLGRVLNPSVR
jgi:serpin B